MIQEPELSYNVPKIAKQRIAGLSLILWWSLIMICTESIPTLIAITLHWRIEHMTIPQMGAVLDWTETASYLIFVQILMFALRGLAQYWVLRPYIPRFQRWIPLTVLAWLVQTLVPDLLPFLALPIPLLAAAANGTVQWLALRTRLRSAAWWIGAVTLGLRTASELALRLNQLLYPQSTIRFALSTMLGIDALRALVYGLITGITLVWLLRLNSLSSAEE